MRREEAPAHTGQERPLEFHDKKRTVLASIESSAVSECVAALEAAFLHHPAGSRIFNEIVAPDDVCLDLADTEINEFLENLRTDALVPVRLAYPVAHFDVILSYVDVAVLLIKVGDAADHFTGGFEFYGPGIVVREDLAYDLEAFLDTVVRGPAGFRTHFRVRGILIKGILVGLPPSSKYGPLSSHCQDSFYRGHKNSKNLKKTNGG